MTATIAGPPPDVRTGRPALRHMPALDGLRGVAVAGVLLFHAGHLVGGYLGVDLFFVLSGFLITSLLLRVAHERGGISLPQFWVRRARRLLPALFGLLLGVAAYAWLLAEPTELARIRADGLATLAYVANWRSIFAQQDYWDLFTAPSPLQHMWSVAIEEQFYLLWPFVVVGLLRWRGAARLPEMVFVTASSLAVASLALMVWLYEPGEPTRVYFGTDTRAASILLGAAFAAWSTTRRPRDRSANAPLVHRAGLVGAAVLVVAWTQVDGKTDWLYRGGLFVLALATIAVIASVSSPEPGALGRALSVRPLRWLGQVSYAAYLWHWPIYLVLHEDNTGLDGWALVALEVAATLLAATASYHLVEQPIRHGAVRGPRMAVLASATVGAVVVALLVGTVGARGVQDGFTKPETLEQAVAKALAASEEATDPERILVVGNSIGISLGPGFEALDDDPEPVVFNRGVEGCNYPLADDMRDASGNRPAQGLIDCTSAWADDVAALDPDVVVMTAMAHLGNFESSFEGRWLTPCMPAYADVYAAELRRSVTELSAGGATVAILTLPYTDLPGLPDEHFDLTDCANAVVADVAEELPAAVLVDLAGYLCPSRGTCRSELDGVTVRPDGVHYTRDSAPLVAAWIMDEVRRNQGPE